MKKLIFVAILFIFISCEDEYVSPCADVDCSNHGACRIDENNKLYCSCESGYHSKNLECIKNNPEDLCEGITCSNHGTCENNSGLASCICDNGYHTDGLECLENGSGDSFKIRLMAANTTSGKKQSYQAPGIRIFKAIKADVVMVQEFNYKDGTIRDLVDKAFASSYYFSSGVGGIPNGVITNYKILKYGHWDDPNISNRDLDWAIVDIPGDKDLFVVSVHLHTSPSSHQVIASQVIAKEISKIKKAHPNKYYYVVGGDFNGSSSVSDRGFGKYNGENIFVVNNRDKPIGEDGKKGTNASRKKQYDFILASKDLHDMEIPTKFCASNDTNDCKIYNNGLVFDTRNFSQGELEKYFSSALRGDSGAGYMQHMAIVRDFEISY